MDKTPKGPITSSYKQPLVAVLDSIGSNLAQNHRASHSDLPEGKFVFVPAPIRAETKTSFPEEDSELPPPFTLPQQVDMPIALLRAQAANRFGGLTLHNSRKGIDQTYHLRMSNITSITTSAGGVWAAAVITNPSSSFSEWSLFAPLFDEVKLELFSVAVFCSQQITSSASGTMVMGAFLNNTTTPASANAVLMSGSSRPVSVCNYTSIPSKIVLKPGVLNWASTSSPSPGPYAGCPGSIQVYGTSLPVSLSIGSMTLVGRYILRGRL